jgi:hypothetical protein
MEFTPVSAYAHVALLRGPVALTGCTAGMRHAAHPRHRHTFGRQSTSLAPRTPPVPPATQLLTTQGSSITQASSPPSLPPPQLLQQLDPTADEASVLELLRPLADVQLAREEQQVAEALQAHMAEALRAAGGDASKVNDKAIKLKVGRLAVALWRCGAVGP